MSKPTTLGEVLDKWEGKGRATFGQTGGAIHAFTQDLRRILYGTDEPCPVCGGEGWLKPYEKPARGNCVTTYSGRPCGSCGAGGRIKTPGLVGRWMVFLCYAAGVVGEDARAPDEFRPVLVGDVLEFLRREIGETV